MMRFTRTVIFTLLITFLIPPGCRETPEPPLPDDSFEFGPCIPHPGTSLTLDIVAFNVESFPKNGYTSVLAAASLMKTIGADVYALQEVASESAFNQLVSLMPGYTGIFYIINNSDWNLAYIIRTSEITVDEAATRLLFTDSQYFPRPPFEIKIKHKLSGRELYLINNHLKCCGGSENEASRRNASEMLKTYLDTYRADDAVAVLGDLNDEITGSGINDNPFLNFINDPSNYLFADMEIARGSMLWWSYPSYPSHIDHILVTDELFADIDTTIVYKPAPCYPDYQEFISDHRPVGIKLSPSLP